MPNRQPTDSLPVTNSSDTNRNSSSINTNHQSNGTAASRRHAIISEPIAPTLFRLTMPMLYALVAIMGLGLVDSYFISFLGTEELAAIGFIVPIAFTMTSVSLGLGMAISSLTSKLIGANRTESAARLITDGFYLTVGVSILLSLALTWQLENIFLLVGAQAETMPAIMSYMHTWLVGCVFLMLTQVCSSTFRAIGDTKTSAVISVVLTLINLILDPLLIFGYGPFPALGIQGAALATVIAVCSAVCMAFYHLGVKEKLLLIQLPSWQVFKQNFNELIHIAIPAMLANAIVPITGAAMTSLVAVFGTQAVAGFGVGGRIEAISLLFSDDGSVQDVIKMFLWLIPASYGFSGMVVLINVSMNVLGKPRTALYINLARLFLIYFPLAYFGAQLYELKGLLLGITIGNIIAFALAFSLLKRTLSELKIDF